jgi:hypothetical protein
MEENVTESLIKEIKQKRELSGIADEIIYDSLIKILKNNRLSENDLDKLPKNSRKIIIKDVRSDLRLLHGRFQSSSKSRETLLDGNEIEKLLLTHSSTKERIEFYPELRKMIASLKIKSILDLGCGLNPIALANPELEYYASDINNTDLLLVEKFFKKNNISGKVFFYDLRKINESDLPKADLCIILKVFDIIESKGHKLAELILKKVDCKFFIVSFSTKKLSGKKMNHPKREWMNKLLNRINMNFKIIELDNEIFYIITK